MYICGPRISIARMRFPLEWRNSIFVLKNWFLLIIWKWLGVATYFCFIFKKVNKIRKKNPKCDSLFWKRWSVKNHLKMKLTWKLRSKSMNTRIDYAHMSIRICINDDQNGCSCIPGQWSSMRYQEVRLVHK